MTPRPFAVVTAIAFLLVSGAAARAADAPREAVDQIASQAEDFRERGVFVDAGPQEAPEIHLEDDKPPFPDEEGPEFHVRTILFEGNTLVPESAFERYVEPFENRKTTFARLKEFTQIVTDHYRALGYTTSRAYLPPQTVQDETVTVKVIEGKIGKIHVEGNQSFKDSVYAGAIRLRRDRIFRYQDLETSLYFLNQQPDRKAKAFLIAGADPGTSDIILKATDSNPFHASYEFNNRGTALTHRARHVTTLVNNNLTGAGDTGSASFSAAEEGAFDAASLSYALPWRERDATFTLDGTYARTAVVKHLKPLEIEGTYASVTPGVLLTVHRTPSLVAEMRAALEVKDSRIDVDDEKSSFDRMRVLVAGPRLTLQDAASKTSISADAHVGIPDFLGGSSDDDVNLSREGSSGEFAYFTAGIAQVRKIPFSSYLLLRANGQWSPDTLTSLETFRAGGAGSVRGYPESDSAGDSGYGASAEVNLPFFVMPRAANFPGTKKSCHDAVRLVGFLDAAETFDEDRFLAGTGVGVRVNLDRTFALQCDVGWPIGDESGEKDGRRTHLSVRAGF